MTQLDDEWVSSWVIRKNLGYEQPGIVQAQHVAAHVVEVKRLGGLSTVRISFFKAPLVDEETIELLLAEDPHTRALFNLERDALVTQNGFSVARAAGVPILRFGEAPTALGVPDPAAYVSQDNVFIERGLRQHRRVVSLRQIGQSDYELTSDSGDRLTVCVRADYEVTAVSVRRSIDAFPAIDVYATSNPNARVVSQEADAAGDSAGVRVFLWRDLMHYLRGPWT